MHNAVLDMLGRYNCTNVDEYREALKEIIQEIALLGLYRANFFDHAAFYGGTALRIFYGLDRFSEDLDFSLDTTDPDFDLTAYLSYVGDELGSFGFEVEVSKKEKKGDSPIESAFIKAGTRIHLIKIGFTEGLLPEAAPREKLKVKLEVDINPPSGAEYEIKYQLRPIPFHVRLFKPPYLFAGKVHALLCRQWGGGRVKGRDLYDFLWFLARDLPLNINYLKKQMIQSGNLASGANLNRSGVVEMLGDKFAVIDYRQAKRDLLPFINKPERVDLWSEHFFKTVTADKLRIDQ